MARPNPLAAPVTMAVCPANSIGDSFSPFTLSLHLHHELSNIEHGLLNDEGWAKQSRQRHSFDIHHFRQRQIRYSIFSKTRPEWFQRDWVRARATP
jgi:hypothetical protein